MQLATVSNDGQNICVAYLSDGRMLDIAKASQGLTGPGASALQAGTMLALIDAGSDALAALAELLSDAAKGNHTQAIVSAEARLQAPIPTPRKNVLCVGRNYAEHIAEAAKAQKQDFGQAEHPTYFTKPPTSIVGPDGDILVFPSLSEAIDYEVELAVIIGLAGRNIPKSKAMDHIFGYTILNDVTARDVQRRHGGQYFKGKGLDGSCPLGPWIKTADAIADPNVLSIGLKVNGEQRQDGNTKDLIFDIPTLIASLSEGMTLEPGDIIATGTPSGVGYAMDPPRFLKDGDTVVCEISGIGTLSNTVRAV